RHCTRCRSPASVEARPLPAIAAGSGIARMVAPAAVACPMTPPSPLAEWIARYLPEEFRLRQPVELLALPGDAGFRRYFRVASEPPVMATDAPPNQENIPAFVCKALALARGKVRVPRV